MGEWRNWLYAHDSKPCPARGEGSIPSSPTHESETKREACVSCLVEIIRFLELPDEIDTRLECIVAGFP